MSRLTGIFLALAILLGPAALYAQMTGNVDRLKADLHGDNLDRAVAAASALGSLKDPMARDALMGAIQLGAPPKLYSALLEALGLHKSPKTLGILEQATHNRNPDLRVVALRALASVESPLVPPILIQRLGDSNPMVRATAARLLGNLKERRAERALFKMLIRGDRSAAAPLGMIAGAETAKRLAERLGEVPDSALAVAFGEMLQRKNFGADPLRTEIVKTLGKIPGRDATAALVEYVASVPEKEVRLSKKEAEKILEGRKQ